MYVEQPLHTWDESYLIIKDKLFDVLLQLACQYFTDYFCVYVRLGYGLKFSFLGESLLGFGIRMMLVS